MSEDLKKAESDIDAFCDQQKQQLRIRNNSIPVPTSMSEAQWKRRVDQMTELTSRSIDDACARLKSLLLADYPNGWPDA